MTKPSLFRCSIGRILLQFTITKLLTCTYLLNLLSLFLIDKFSDWCILYMVFYCSNNFKFPSFIIVLLLFYKISLYLVVIKNDARIDINFIG